MLIRAYPVRGEFRVHGADCRDCTREGRRSDSGAYPEELPSKAAVIRSLWSGIIAEYPGFYGPPDGVTSLEADTEFLPTPSSCPAPASGPLSDPAGRNPASASVGPAPQETAAGGPRADGDAIAVDIATRVSLVTVRSTGCGHARACPAAGRAFTCRGRRYTGSVLCSGPGWHGSAGLGLSLGTAGVPAGQSIADTIAAIIGAAGRVCARAQRPALVPCKLPDSRVRQGADGPCPASGARVRVTRQLSSLTRPHSGWRRGDTARPGPPSRQYLRNESASRPS